MAGGSYLWNPGQLWGRWVWVRVSLLCRIAPHRPVLTVGATPQPMSPLYIKAPRKSTLDLWVKISYNGLTE